MRILLDTNIVIPLEDSSRALEPHLARLTELANANGHQLLVHPASYTDINRDASYLNIRMKKLFAALAALFGLSGASASEEVKMVDPKTLLYSLATISDELPALDSLSKAKEGDLVLLEDDWRQFEVVSRAHLPLVNAEVADIQRIFTEKSKPVGNFRAFTELHVRKRLPNPLQKPLRWSDFSKACAVTSASTVSFRGAPTIIANGFSVQLHGLSLYGLRDGDNITTLGFVSTQTPALPIEAAERLAAFLEANDLILVHWPSATVFTDKPTLLDYLQQKPEQEAAKSDRH